MVYKVKLNSSYINPIIHYLDKYIHSDECEEGKLILNNGVMIIFDNKTRFEIIDDEYIKLNHPDACLKIDSIVGVSSGYRL